MNSQNVLTQQQLDAIQQFDTCRIANAIETLGIRLRDRGYTRPGLKSYSGYSLSALGYAAPARLKTTGPPVTGRSYLDRTDWWDYVVTIPGPRIAVFEDLDDPPGSGAALGEVHVEVLRALGCTGVVTNGSVRDIPAVRAIGFPLFAQSTSVSHSYVHFVDFGVPVRILGLPISPGDLIYADCHGVLTIPLEAAHELPTIAHRQAARERRVIDLCRSTRFSLESLRDEVNSPS